MTTTKIDFKHPFAAPLRIVVKESGFLLGNSDSLYITTRQGNAGGTITITRQQDEQTEMRSSYLMSNA